MFWFFGHKACVILAPRPGIEPAPPALEGKVLTIDHQGSPITLLIFRIIYLFIYLFGCTRS